LQEHKSIIEEEIQEPDQALEVLWPIAREVFQKRYTPGLLKLENHPPFPLPNQYTREREWAQFLSVLEFFWRANRAQTYL